MTTEQRLRMYSIVGAAVALPLIFLAGPGPALAGIASVALAAVISEVAG